MTCCEVFADCRVAAICKVSVSGCNYLILKQKLNYVGEVAIGDGVEISLQATSFSSFSYEQKENVLGARRTRFCACRETNSTVLDNCSTQFYAEIDIFEQVSVLYSYAVLFWYIQLILCCC